MSPSPKPITSEHAKVIDRLGEIQAQIAPLEKEEEKLKIQIRDWYKDEAADKALSASGKRYTVIVGQCALERFIKDMPALFARLKKAVFLAQCSFNLGPVEKLLPEPEHGQYIGGGRTGKRPVKTVARAA